MFVRCRKLIALLLAALVVAPPASAAGAKPLGIVLDARNATLRSVDSLPGSTVFAGDTLLCDHAGHARVRIGTAQIEVMPDSFVIFEEIDAAAGANLLQGTIGFAAPENGTVAVRAAGILIRPQTKQPTQGRVRILGPTEFLITSYRGPLELTMGDASLVVPEGTTYRVVQGDSQGPGPVGAGAEAAKQAKFTAFLVAAAVAAVPIVLAVRYNVASPHRIF